jgi:hypothetical protein
MLPFNSRHNIRGWNESGAGGFALVPSLDLVIYKMGGNNGQYDPTLTDVPQPALKESREGREGSEGSNKISSSTPLQPLPTSFRRSFA